MTNIVLTIMMFAAFILFWAAWKMRSATELRFKMLLMIVAGLVIIANVVIWTLPTENGKTLADDNIERAG